jgi:molybdopterin converting factor small subunit
MIRVLLFGACREAAGENELTLEFDQAPDVIVEARLHALRERDFANFAEHVHGAREFFVR